VWPASGHTVSGESGRVPATNRTTKNPEMMSDPFLAAVHSGCPGKAAT